MAVNLKHIHVTAWRCCVYVGPSSRFLTVGYGVTVDTATSTSVLGLCQTQKEEPVGVRILGRDSLAGVGAKTSVLGFTYHSHEHRTPGTGI